MNGILILLASLVYFAVCYKLYGGVLTKVFGVDKDRPTPASTKYDGVDYVPSHPAVLFGHHFASIAGAGPIVGPIMASYFGWLPALLWILIGCVFIGAVHDFAAMFLSVRNEGKSIGYIIEKLMGWTGRQLFLIFCFACLILVVAIFGLMVAGTFISTPAVATASIFFILVAPIFGLLARKFLGLKVASIIFVPIVFASVWFSTKFPMDISSWGLGLSAEDIKWVWLAVLGVYVFVASVTPVQWLLQPRDYLSSYLLYAMIALGIVGIIVYNPSVNIPDIVGYKAIMASGSEAYIFPSLFILVACGACSGFHSLVASGTTSKQISNEKHVLPLGYGGMIVEGILAVMSLITVVYLSDADFQTLAKNPVQAFAHGIGTFTEVIGLPKEIGVTLISLSISTFMMTSLDTATRLARFVWQELFTPSEDKIAKMKEVHMPIRTSKIITITTNSAIATFIVVGLSGIMVSTGSASSIWPIFGASNQLLAALTLLAVTMYLMLKKANFWITLLPTVLMMVMSIWGLVDVVNAFWDKSRILVVSSIFLIFMASLLVILPFIIMRKNHKDYVSQR